MAVEQLPQSPDPGSPAHAVDCRSKLLGVGEAALVGFIDRGLETVSLEECGDVDQCADRACDRDSVTTRHVARDERPAADHDARPATPHGGRHGDVDCIVPGRADLPERRGAAVAEDGFGTATQDRCHPAPVPRQRRPADRVNAPPDRVKAAVGEPVLDRLLREAELEQLAAGDHAVLSSHEFPRPLAR
jgi:hypothetical protein